MRLTLSDEVGLACYGYILIRSVWALLRGIRKPKANGRPGVVIALCAVVAGSLAAITCFTIADGTSATVARLQAWLLWPTAVIFVGSFVVASWFYVRLRRSDRAGQ